MYNLKQKVFNSFDTWKTLIENQMKTTTKANTKDILNFYYTHHSLDNLNSFTQLPLKPAPR